MNEKYENHLKELRESYVNASFKQRLKVVQDRINYPDCSANRLISLVSSIEGLSRTICLDILETQGESRLDIYKKVKFLNPNELIVDYIFPAINKSAEDLFGHDIWEVFLYAVKYRNLLIHEGTFLRQNYASELIDVCTIIFQKLTELEYTR